jgi:hypothetical protein
VEDCFAKKGYILALDNWYTSMDLVKFALNKEIELVGTVRTNRAGLDRDTVIPKSGPNARPKGFMHCVQAEVCPGKQCYFTAWQDNKPVHMLSTFPPQRQPILRHCKSKTDGPYEQVRLWIPTNIPLYNRGMGGTDLIDQLASYYRTTLEAKRSTIRIFTHFVMVTMINAMILFRAINNVNVTLFQFLDKLINQLTSTEPNLAEAVRSAAAANRLDRSLCHCLVRVDDSTGKECVSRCARHYCCACKSKTSYMCDECQTPLCVSKAGAAQNCFKRFHTMPGDSFKFVRTEKLR